MPKNIKLIIGSTRENRIAPQIAEWVQTNANRTDISLEILDLKEVDLPAFAAPIPPAYAPTDTEAGKAWASQIEAADGFIFLTAEYNRSIPSSLKNALDYLVAEWKEKPAVIVSYGYIDGGQSATRHLRDIFDWLKIRTIEPTIALQLSQETVDENGQIKDSESSFAGYVDDLDRAVSELV